MNNKPLSLFSLANLFKINQEEEEKKFLLDSLSLFSSL